MYFFSRSPNILILLSLLVILKPCDVQADERDDRILALEQQLQELAVEIKELKKERKEEREHIAKASEKAEKAIYIATQSANEKISNENKVDKSAFIETGMNGSMPTFKSGEFSFQPTGRIHADAVFFDDDSTDHPTGTLIRRARFGFNGTLPHDLGYRLAVDFGNENVALRDAFLSYNGIDNTQIRVGDFKPGFMLEEMISSNDMTFIERVPVVNAFTNSRRIGAAFDTHGERWTLEAGLFGAQAGTQSNDDEQWSIAARSTFAPVLDDDKTLHFGGSWSYRVPDQVNDTFDFDAKANNSVQRIDSVSAVVSNVESTNVYALEAATTMGPLSLQGEYLVADVDRISDSNLLFHGGYGQVSWFLTGQSRSYSVKDGAYKNPKITRALNPKKGQWGALEIAGRYSYLDLNDENITGGQIETTDLGLNWYLNDNSRLMGNLIFVDTDENAVTPNDDPTLLVLRAQVDF